MQENLPESELKATFENTPNSGYFPFGKDRSSGFNTVHAGLNFIIG
jgi:hypothetical protein